MSFEKAVDLKIAGWHASREWPELYQKSVHEAWGDIAREVKKYSKGGRSDEMDRAKLITVAAFCKLGYNCG